MQRLIIGLVLLALLAIGIDRGAEFAAGWVAAGRIAEQARVEHRPKVDFHGIPFVTQALRGEFERVDVQLRGVRSKQDLRIDRLDTELRGVRLLDGNPVRAEAMTGRALVIYPDLSAVANGVTRISYGGDGLVRVTRTIEALGRQRSVTALGRASVTDGVLMVKPERFETGMGALDQVVGRVSLRAFAIRVPLRGLPKGVDVDLRAGEAGIDVRFSGDDLVLVPERA